MAGESFFHEVHEARRRLPPLMTVPVMPDVIPGLDDGAHRQQQRVCSAFSLYLGKDLLLVPAAVGDLEDLADDGRVDEADAHEAWARRLKSESQARPFSTFTALSRFSGSFRKRSRIPRVSRLPMGP